MILARVAESLYWMGRNIERSDHCVRYLKVQYNSTLEPAMAQNKDFALRSILFMAGTDINSGEALDEAEVWRKVLYDASNPNSMFSLVWHARENARSIRNTISAPLWESINRWYLFCKQAGQLGSNSQNIFQFCDELTAHIAQTRATMYNTLLHGDVWRLTCLGIYVERTLQVLRILHSKISDSAILTNNGDNKALLFYQWTNLLKSLEAFDIHNSLSRGLTTRAGIFELVLSNIHFPRSLSHSTSAVEKHLTKISVRPSNFDEMSGWYAEKHEGFLGFSDFEDEEKVIDHIEATDAWMREVHDRIENLYFPRK